MEDLQIDKEAQALQAEEVEQASQYLESQAQGDEQAAQRQEEISKASTQKLMVALREKGKHFYLATGQQARPSMAYAKNVLKRCMIETLDDVEEVKELYRRYCLFKGYENPLNKEEKACEIV